MGNSRKAREKADRRGAILPVEHSEPEDAAETRGPVTVTYLRFVQQSPRGYVRVISSDLDHSLY